MFPLLALGLVAYLVTNSRIMKTATDAPSSGTGQIWEIGFRVTNPANVRQMPTPDEWSKVIGGKLANIRGAPNADGTMQVTGTFIFSDPSKIPPDYQRTYIFPSGLFATVVSKKFVR